MKPPPDSQRAVALLFQGALDGSFEADSLAGRYDLEQGLALQLAVLERWRERGELLGGWKVGMTSGRARDALGPGFRPFGFILASRIFPSGATLEHARISRCGLEAELCLAIGSPLAGAEVTREQARAAVASVAAGFEINELRPSGEVDGPVRVADNLAQWGIAVGEDASRDRDLDALEVEVWRDDERVAAAAAPGLIDDHFESLARLSAQLDAFGLGLEPGQRVITGAFSRHRIDAPGRWRADFSGVGSVELDFR